MVDLDHADRANDQVTLSFIRQFSLYQSHNAQGGTMMMSVLTKLVGVGSIFFLGFGFTIVATRIGLETISATRAYVEGESIYSRNAHLAVDSLLLYANTRDRSHYLKFQQSLASPVSYREARLEMEKPNPDVELIRRGLIAGGTHPDDVKGIARIFRWFGSFSQIGKALALWRECDGQVVELIQLGKEIDAKSTQFIGSQHTDQSNVEKIIKKIEGLDAKIKILAMDFSKSLGDVARYATNLLVTLMLVVFTFVGGLALTIYVVFCKDILKMINQIKLVSKSMAKGDFSLRLPMGNPQDCSGIKKCAQRDCPSFGKASACWVEAGSFSANPLCPRAKAGGDCRQCEVYQLGKLDEIAEMGAAFNAFADVLAHHAKVAHIIANGDLTQRVHVSSDKDILGDALERMRQQLNDTMHRIHEVSSEVATSSQQISMATADLSQGAIRQAGFFEEVSSSLGEVNQKVQQTAVSGQQAMEVSVQSREALNLAKIKMDGVSEAMKDVVTTVNKITGIIKTINAVAFQTNLLALNAAVEAAHAGQHGKGFAIVADEVRTLSARSAKAADETRGLIDEITEKVGRSHDLTAQLMVALGHAIQSMNESERSVTNIAHDAGVQAHALSEIAQGLIQINTATQQNSACGEEIASVTTQMAGQAHELNGMTGRFRVHRG